MLKDINLVVNLFVSTQISDICGKLLTEVARYSSFSVLILSFKILTTLNSKGAHGWVKGEDVEIPLTVEHQVAPIGTLFKLTFIIHAIILIEGHFSKLHLARCNNFDDPTSSNTPPSHFCESSVQCYLARDLPEFGMFMNIRHKKNSNTKKLRNWSLHYAEVEKRG